MTEVAVAPDSGGIWGAIRWDAPWNIVESDQFVQLFREWPVTTAFRVTGPFGASARIEIEFDMSRRFEGDRPLTAVVNGPFRTLGAAGEWITVEVSACRGESRPLRAVLIDEATSERKAESAWVILWRPDPDMTRETGWPKEQ